MKKEEIKKRTDSGRFFNLPNVRVRCEEASPETKGVDVVIPAKLVKKAVDRNRLRRRIKEYIRQNSVIKNSHVVIWVKNGDFLKIKKDLAGLRLK